MGSRWKAEKVFYNIGVEGSWDYIRIGVKHSDISGCAILSRKEFQQPGKIWKVITPKPFTVSRYVNNSWKEKNHIYIFSMELKVRFWS
jgi:hypothetical protein